MIARRDTKAIISEVALRLFAERGYDGTGMRDIAEAVGIQPASLYKHYANKQAIFDAVVDRMNAAYDALIFELQMPDEVAFGGVAASVTPDGVAVADVVVDNTISNGMHADEVAGDMMSRIAEGYASLPPGAIEAMSVAMFRYWTEDERAVLFRRLLVMEQYRNPVIGKLYRSYFVEKPLAYQTILFEEMMRAGYFKKGDARLMAIEFFSPILLLMVAADGCENVAERDEVVACLCAHVKRFGIMYARD
ncbi:MAG: helix-turn-helix domain-containing protein [Gordonibacter sp.]|nr:helix-turn-helix domain-containing protein [Gordonibacter sp.]